MSLRLFVYYCALCGGAAALAGWLLGRVATGRHVIGEAGIKGFFLGMLVAAALSILDGVVNLSGQTRFQAFLRVVAAGLGGAVGGLIAAVVGQVLYGALNHWSLLLLGWTLTGLLIGASIGAFGFLLRLFHEEDVRPAWGKLYKGMIGGAAGGALGGAAFLGLKVLWEDVFRNKEGVFLWSPSATGFCGLGACIGLAIGLTQVILREGWLRVESGFRAGRELLLAKSEVIIGRAESCDLGLFGDPAVDGVHARIVQQGPDYLLIDAGSSAGTLLNGQRIHEPTPLQPGDRIQIGRSVLSFGR